VAGIDGKVVLQGDDSGAQSFADRLLTLPTHRGVTPEDVRRFVRVMRKLL
jgi:dTDP-4-amino-4,6-dideoxygalactose transaminase